MGNAIDLFGHAVEAAPKKKWNLAGKRMHDNLIMIYGGIDDKCKNCKHLHRFRYSQTFYKCAIAEQNVKSGPSGDWRVNYQACGKFERDQSC